MKKVVIIGANEFQNPLILKAKELGYETHVFAWEEGAVGKENTDYFYPISIVEKEQILQKCIEIKPDAVTTIASDLATLTVNYIAEKLKLPGNSMKCTEKSTNKYKMRQAFKDANIPVPKFEFIEKNIDYSKLENMEYPLIVKPTDRSGSRAITKIYKKEELEKAIENAIENSFEKRAIVEEYIDGDEFSIEGITYNGQHKFLTITRKETTGAPHFIETGHIEPAGLTKEQEKLVKEMISKALNALEVTNSATHAEFKIKPNGDIRIIEIGARMGGDCIGSTLVQISTGYDFLKMVLDVALGNEPSFEKISEPKNAIIKFIFGNEDLKKLERIKKECPENIYEISPIEDINSHEVVDSGSRFGYYILACENKDKIRWLLNDKEQY